MNPLEKAIRENNLNQLRLLLDLGYEINEETEDGEPLLHFAIDNDSSLEIIKTLIDHDADVFQTNSVDSTLLHLIAQKENPSDADIELIHYLVDKGINVDSKDQWSDTPIAWAANRRSFRVVEALLDCGADVNQNVIDGALFGHSLQHCELNNRCKFASLFNLSEVFEEKYEEIALLLLNNGATVWDEKYATNSPLVGAVWNNALPVVRLMLNKGLNPNAVNYSYHIDTVMGRPHDPVDGYPLYGALIGVDSQILEELILHGADPSTLNPNDRRKFDQYEWQIKASKIRGIVNGIINYKTS